MSTSLASPGPPWFQNGFHRYLRRLLCRHFHSIGFSGDLDFFRRLSPDDAIVIFGNHPSWWDPMIAQYLNRRLMPDRQFYAPIDAAALANYRVLSKLGFFGVELNSRNGAVDFLKHSDVVLSSKLTSLWLTPEGRFTDARDHSIAFEPGLAHICSRMTRGFVLPMAVEYIFWDERLPECLVRIGDPIAVVDFPAQSKRDWNTLLTRCLRDNQTRLAEIAIKRSTEGLTRLLHGKQGSGLFYDSVRWMKSIVTGQEFRAQHSEKW